MILDRRLVLPAGLDVEARWRSRILGMSGRRMVCSSPIRWWAMGRSTWRGRRGKENDTAGDSFHATFRWPGPRHPLRQADPRPYPRARHRGPSRRAHRRMRTGRRKIRRHRGLHRRANPAHTPAPHRYSYPRPSKTSSPEAASLHRRGRAPPQEASRRHTDSMRSTRPGLPALAVGLRRQRDAQRLSWTCAG